MATIPVRHTLESDLLGSAKTACNPYNIYDTNRRSPMMRSNRPRNPIQQSHPQVMACGQNNLRCSIQTFSLNPQLVYVISQVLGSFTSWRDPLLPARREPFILVTARWSYKIWCLSPRPHSIESATGRNDPLKALTIAFVKSRIWNSLDNLNQFRT